MAERTEDRRPAFYKTGKFSEPIAYAAKYQDDAVRLASMSGGAFTALSDRMLEIGGVVYGCVLEDNRRAVLARAETKEERDRMRGSKYIQSETADTYAQVKRDLENGRQVLYSGTSCQIAGLQGFLGKSYEGLVCVDIVCHGVPSPLLWRTYLDWQEKQNKEPVVSAVFRNKRDFGWGPHVETLRFRSGKVVNSKIFSSLFYRHTFLRPCCYQCPYKDVIHPGNISIADCWGIDKVRPELVDDKGVSLILINDEVGKAFFEAAKRPLACFPVNVNELLQKPLIEPYPAPENRDAEWADFRSLSFSKFVKDRFSVPFMTRLKRKVYRMIHGK